MKRATKIISIFLVILLLIVTFYRLFNIEQKNLKMRLNSAFRSLSDTERKCISLYVDGLKQREICKLLDLKPKQVDNALTRAKRVIKNKYNLAHYLKS